jgi:hypothetical protein
MGKAIVARVFGGLGNQLFIYAHARALANRTGAKLFLDTKTGFRNDPYKRTWDLHHYPIQFEEAGRLRSFDFWGGKYVRRLLKEVNNRIFQYNYLVETDCEKFNLAIHDYQPNQTTWFEGYWQSPFYFEDAVPLLQKELQLKTSVSVESCDLAKKMRSVNSVCLHARRLRNELVGEENAKIKTLSIEYYQKAIEKMSYLVENPHFFCFSDDPTWLKDAIRIPFPTTIVTHNAGDAKNYEDLWLMQQCKHFIISNSTFPWWAAWMGNFPTKKVIAPDLYFWDCKDVLPENWIVNF